MAKQTKKIDYKGIAKASVMEMLQNALQAQGTSFVGGADYGFSGSAIVLKDIVTDGGTFDLCLTLTAPKAGQDSYEYRRVAEDAE